MTGDDDLEHWFEETRSVKPISGKKRITPEPKKPRRVTVRPRDPEPDAIKEVQHSPLPQKQVRKLRQQKFPVEARIDLHGMTVEKAHLAVDRFLKDAVHNRLRCIEIITGKGDPALGRGELRRMLPIWMDLPGIKKHVLHVEPNPVSRGGSFLIMLRRTKLDN